MSSRNSAAELFDRFTSVVSPGERVGVSASTTAAKQGPNGKTLRADKAEMTTAAAREVTEAAAEARAAKTARLRAARLAQETPAAPPKKKR